jgi:hypothetical protein
MKKNVELALDIEEIAGQAFALNTNPRNNDGASQPVKA